MAFDRTHGHANGRPRHAVQVSSPRNVGRLDKAINREPRVRIFLSGSDFVQSCTSVSTRCSTTYVYSLQMTHTHHLLPFDDQDIDQGRSQGDFVASTAFYTFVAQATYATKQASIRSMHTTYHSLFHPLKTLKGLPCMSQEKRCASGFAAMNTCMQLPELLPALKFGSSCLTSVVHVVIADFGSLEVRTC
jgi:hypothetical protein